MIHSNDSTPNLAYLNIFSGVFNFILWLFGFLDTHLTKIYFIVAICTALYTIWTSHQKNKRESQVHQEREINETERPKDQRKYRKRRQKTTKNDHQ